MTAVDVVPAAPQQAPRTTSVGSNGDGRGDVPVFAGALVALLDDARTGRVSATAPGELWLILRIEEALRGFADIQAMAADNEPEPFTWAGDTSEAAVVVGRTRPRPSANRVGPPLGGASVPSPA